MPWGNSTSFKESFIPRRMTSLPASGKIWGCVRDVRHWRTEGENAIEGKLFTSSPSAAVILFDTVTNEFDECSWTIGKNVNITAFIAEQDCNVLIEKRMYGKARFYSRDQYRNKDKLK